MTPGLRHNSKVPRLPQHPCTLRFWLAILCCGWLLPAIAPAQQTSPAADSGFPLAQRAKQHWAWQALQDPTPPPPDPHWPRHNEVDDFIHHTLRSHGLTPAPRAPAHQLLRRLWLDLCGLPPPPDEVANFVANPSPAAYEQQVDRLLAMPAYAERWARHWLDLVRYAETLGHEYDFEVPNAWRYRDYVVRALHQDLPFDQFVREHLAGDLLPVPRRGPTGDNESVQATAFWWFAEQTHSPVDPKQHQSDRIDNQIDVLGKAVLGLTVSCARCHDHKFDAISASDYYALYGYLLSSRYVQAPLQQQDVHGSAYRAAVAGQRQFAGEYAKAAVADGSERWRALAERAQVHWSGSAGFGPLRAGEELLAHADGPAKDWLLVNDGFGARPWRGPFCPDPAATAPQVLLLPGSFWHSGIAGPAREGVLQTQDFVLRRRYLHVRAAGQHSRVNVVVDGLHLVRDPIYGPLHRAVQRPEAHWLSFDTQLWQGRTAFVQCLDQRAQDLADADHESSPYPESAWLAIQAVVASDLAEPPLADQGVGLPAVGWQQAPANVLAAAQQLQALQAALPVYGTVPAIDDGTGADEPVHLRGNPRSPGALSPRRFLTALAGSEPMAIRRGSGRLQLAAAVMAPDNPLPARVFANRLWHHLFGRGLVRSVDNLGALGDPPSHPELLDWLARECQRRGWSQKQVLRLLVTSATYQQESREQPAASAVDPDNVWLHRQNLRRLEAEALRDCLLAVSGSLRMVALADGEAGGPSVPIPLDADHEARGRPKRSGPLDGDGRRSVYLAVRRNFMPPMLQAFDLPTPFATVGARSVSNVPAQALTLLNDPLVHLLCERWAARLCAETGEADAWVERAWLEAVARQPAEDERALALQFMQEAAGPPVQALSDLLHGLLNTTEFRYRR